MRVTFLGSGDAFGSGGRFNTCIHVAANDRSFLVDCGASSMIAVRRFGVDPNSIGAVLVSHLHGDHFAGLPFLILDAQLYSRRTAPLVIAGPPGLEARLKETMEALFPGSGTAARKFDTRVVELEPGKSTEIAGTSVTPFQVEHYCGAPPFALRLQCDGKVIAYTGDTQWTEALLEASRDADLLIAESLFYDKKVKWHLDYATLMSHKEALSARRIVLTHMGPEMLSRLSEVSAECADDGMAIEV